MSDRQLPDGSGIIIGLIVSVVIWTVIVAVACG